MASDYLLEIDGIKGESLDKKHPGSIEVFSFSWGVSQTGTFGTGGGGGAGKASFQDLHFTSTVSKASPLLARACATGEHIKKAVLYVRKAGDNRDGNQAEFYKVTLEDVLVSSYQSAGGGETPEDAFSFNFAKIEYAYSPQRADGSLDQPVVFSYDLKQAKGG
jgi:type VI secretion system secreted protein Hcp